MGSIFSVIIPSFNRAWTLPKAIESVLDQSFSDLELIVVDDGSTDETQLILQEYIKKDSRLKVFRIENCGVSRARNYGIEKAQGEWIAFLDSDDQWLRNKLERQLALLKNQERLWCHGSEIWIRDGKELKQKKKHRRGEGDQFHRSLELCCISPSTVVIHKSLLSHQRFREEFPVCEDYDLWLRLSSNNKISYVDQPVIKKFGGHDDQLSLKYHSMDYWRLKSIYLTFKECQLTELKKGLCRQEFSKKLNTYRRGLSKYSEAPENKERLREVNDWELFLFQ